MAISGGSPLRDPAAAAAVPTLSSDMSSMKPLLRPPADDDEEAGGWRNVDDLRSLGFGFSSGGGASSSTSLLRRIRSEFYECGGGDKCRSITGEDLARHWQRLAQETGSTDGGPPAALGVQAKQAIALRVAQLLQEMDLKREGRVGLDEWVHYMLVALSGFHSKQINSLLSKAMERNATLLHDLQAMFHKADEKGTGSLTVREVVEMYSRKLWNFRPGVNSKPLTASELEEGDPESFARELVEVMDIDGNDLITYPEFMAYVLGRRKAEVTLHYYDLSKGAAEAFSPWVVGEQLEGIWHTGIVVYGKEYYFAKDLVFDTAGCTCFGEPTRVISLGVTLWRQEELHEHIVNDLRPIFHRGTYDVIKNNCNHFSDRLSMFLLNQHLPKEVLRQPEYLLKSNFVRIVRPMLNWYLRDRVVAREPGKDLPPGRPRLKPHERPAIGTFVTLHPADTETTVPGVVMLALVRAVEGDAPPSNKNCWFPLLDACTVAGDGHEVHLFSSCGVERARPGCSGNGIWVQYFDFRPMEKSGRQCRAIVRLERVPHARLSLADTDSEAFLSAYRAALQAMGAPACVTTEAGVTGAGNMGASRGLSPMVNSMPLPPSNSGDPNISSPRAAGLEDKVAKIFGVSLSRDGDGRIYQL